MPKGAKAARWLIGGSLDPLRLHEMLAPVEPDSTLMLCSLQVRVIAQPCACLGISMSFTSAAFDRHNAALERAEAGRNGKPLADLTFARIALARRLDDRRLDGGRCQGADPARLSSGPALLIQR